MIILTDEGKRALDRYGKAGSIPPLRIYLRSSCAGMRLMLAQDESGEYDDIIETDGYTFIIDKNLRQKASPITIDGSRLGIILKSKLIGGKRGCYF